MSRARSFVLFKTAANMASRQRCSKVWLYFTQKDDHRATCNACKTSLSSKAVQTIITPKHSSILHAITLQECRVFERYGVKITLMNLNQATASRLTLALHLQSIVLVPFVSLCKPAFTFCLCQFYFFVQGEYTCKKKNSTVIGMFKYYLAQRFSNSGISRTPKLPQIRPGRDPYLIRLPHLMRFLSLDVLLQKLYETHYQISHKLCYLWLELYSKQISWDPLAPHQGKGSLGYGSLDPTLRVC